MREVTLRLHILSGAREGAVFTFERGDIAIGRHPSADVKFDPQRDLDVSTRHARIERAGDEWLIRDLDSRNGTYVNGRRVEDETPIGDGDRIRFGPSGPELEVRIGKPSAGDEPSPTVGQPRAGAPAPTGQPAPTGGPAATGEPAGVVTPPTASAGTSVTGRIRVEVARRTRTLRHVATGLGLLLLVAVGAFFYADRRQRAEWERERARLEQQVDSVLRVGEAAVDSLRAQVEGLATALRDSRREVEGARAALRRAEAEGGEQEDVERLRRELQSATAALRRQQLAASLDFDEIERRGRRATALVYVESQDGEVSIGTAFAVRPDAVMVTARHTVAGEDGRQRPRRIAALPPTLHRQPPRTSTFVDAVPSQLPSHEG